MTNPARTPPPYVERGHADMRRWLDEVQGVRVTPEEIAKMSPAQRLDYCRRFDQNSMPAWRDPRASK
jgi:hypothetical protein